MEDFIVYSWWKILLQVANSIEKRQLILKMKEDNERK
jgi:hypothetical protein